MTFDQWLDEIIKIHKSWGWDASLVNNVYEDMSEELHCMYNEGLSVLDAAEII